MSSSINRPQSQALSPSGQNNHEKYQLLVHFTPQPD
jgi:hypothetical protein